MICEDVITALSTGDLCEESEAGASVLTHCLYPSFDRVRVSVSRFGEGYRVTDGGGAARCAWDHAREGGSVARLIAREAQRYHLTVSDHALVTDVPNIDWLSAAIIAVANASASAAHAAVGKATAAAETALKEKMLIELSKVVPTNSIDKDFELAGKSGDMRHFDFSIKSSNDNILLLSAVAPHHSSIYAKYVAFSDIRELDGKIERFAVFDRPLDRGDTSLLLQVSELVPLASLEPGARRAVAPLQ